MGAAVIGTVIVLGMVVIGLNEREKVGSTSAFSCARSEFMADPADLFASLEGRREGTTAGIACDQLPGSLRMHFFVWIFHVSTCNLGVSSFHSIRGRTRVIRLFDNIDATLPQSGTARALGDA